MIRLSRDLGNYWFCRCWLCQWCRPEEIRHRGLSSRVAAFPLPGRARGRQLQQPQLLRQNSWHLMTPVRWYYLGQCARQIIRSSPFSSEHLWGQRSSLTCGKRGVNNAAIQAHWCTLSLHQGASQLRKDNHNWRSYWGSACRCAH